MRSILVGSDSIGVGIIGAGYWGRKLAGEYMDAERRGKLKLIKVFDSSIAALGALLINKETSSIREERLTQNIEDIMDNPEISAVHIATPNKTHYTYAKLALEAGKNVLVEKPMTLNSGECYDLVNLAKEKRLVLEVGHIFRFNRALQVAGEILRREEIGKISDVRIQWTNLDNFMDRDIIFDLGPHPVDILNQLLATWPETISGFGRGRSTFNQVAYVLAEYPDNIFAHIELSWLYPKKIREVSIVGSKALLVVDCANQHVFKHHEEQHAEIPVIANNTMASEINHFVDRIVDCDSTISLVGPRTVKTLEAVHAAFSLTRTGVHVDFEDELDQNLVELPRPETTVNGNRPIMVGSWLQHFPVDLIERRRT